MVKGGQKIFYSDAEKKAALSETRNGRKNVKVVKTSKPIISKFSFKKSSDNKSITSPVLNVSKIIKPGTPHNQSKIIKPVPINKVKKNAGIIKPGSSKANLKIVKPVVEPKRKKSFGSSQTALQTASAIAANRSHPNHTEVSQLIITFEKGWIDEEKFTELLQGMLF